jgi:hypothetical protein
MTITLELTAEQEAKVRRNAAAAGITPEEYVLRLIREALDDGADTSLFVAGSETETTETIELDGATIAVVDSAAGNVTFRAGAEGRLRIDAKRNYRGGSKKGDGRYSVGVHGDTVHIEYRRPDGHSDGCSIDFTLFGPPSLQLRVDTGGGNIDIGGIAGNVSVQTGGGNVRVDGEPTGSNRISTGGGNIEIGVAHGSVEAHTGGGNIDVRVAGGSVAAHSGAGNVSMSGLLTGDSQIGVGAGNVRVDLPADCGLEVRADTPLGGIETDFGFAVSGRGSGAALEAAIGTPIRGRLQVSTGAGNIRFGKLG